jgi:acyl CoA:acetate/3-ketoacid CoA transferase
MEKIKVNQTEAIKLLKEGADISSYSIEFNDEKIEAIQAIELGKNNINVPEHLIYYDDITIDSSDDPDITKEDIETGKISWMLNTSLPLDKEIKQWIQQEKIDVDKLLTQLVTNFNETVKHIHRNAAI